MYLLVFVLLFLKIIKKKKKIFVCLAILLAFDYIFFLFPCVLAVLGILFVYTVFSCFFKQQLSLFLFFSSLSTHDACFFVFVMCNKIDSCLSSIAFFDVSCSLWFSSVILALPFFSVETDRQDQIWKHTRFFPPPFYLSLYLLHDGFSLKSAFCLILLSFQERQKSLLLISMLIQSIDSWRRFWLDGIFQNGHKGFSFDFSF